MYVIYYLFCQYYPLSLFKFFYKIHDLIRNFRLGHLFIRSGVAVAPPDPSSPHPPSPSYATEEEEVGKTLITKTTMHSILRT